MDEMSTVKAQSKLHYLHAILLKHRVFSFLIKYGQIMYSKARTHTKFFWVHRYCYLLIHFGSMYYFKPPLNVLGISLK